MRVLPLGSPLALTVEMQNAEGCTVSAEVQVKATNGGYEGNYLTAENLQARAELLAGRHYPAWQLSVVCNGHSRRSTPAFGAVLLHRLVKTKQLYTKRIPSGRNERLGGNLFCLFLPPGKGRRLSGCGVLSAAVQLLPFGHSGATAAASAAAFRLPAHAHARALCARAPAGQLPGNCRATAGQLPIAARYRKHCWRRLWPLPGVVGVSPALHRLRRRQLLRLAMSARRSPLRVSAPGLLRHPLRHDVGRCADTPAVRPR